MRFLQEREMVLKTAQAMSGAGLVLGTWGNVSARAGQENQIVITPSGMDYALLNSEDLVIVDFEGVIREGIYKPSVETQMHIAIYKKRPEIGGIVHVHSPHASAFAVARRSIPVILEETAQIIGHEIPVIPYAECGSDTLAELTASALCSPLRALLLANHGLICLGDDVKQALKAATIVEKTAQVALLAAQLGQVHTLTLEETENLHIKAKHYGQAKQ
jgi:L-fuculose-phosphate aldolase